MSTRKLKPNQIQQKKISIDLSRIINRVQREMQMEENFTKGKKARIVSFLAASHELAKRLKDAK